MANIEFSKLNQAILENQELADYISFRVANMDEKEIEEGKIVIKLNTGDHLTLSFPPTRNFSKLMSA